MRELQSMISRMLGPFARRIRLMIGRAVVTTINDDGPIQVVQVKLLDGEVREGVENLHQYGFVSNTPGLREGLYFSVGGDRDHGVMVCVGSRTYRLKALKTGEVAIHDDIDQKVHLTRDGIVVYTPKKCRVDAADIELHASHSYSWDVDGYGERWTSLGGGSYEHKTWQKGAVITSVPLSIKPPEGP